MFQGTLASFASYAKQRAIAGINGEWLRGVHESEPMIQRRLITEWHAPPTPTSPWDGDRDGDTFDPELDSKRLNAQHRRVYGIMKDGYWLTLHEISRRTGDPEASVSARLRDFRKPQFGKHILNSRRSNVESGLWFYQLIWNTKVSAPKEIPPKRG